MMALRLLFAGLLLALFAQGAVAMPQAHPEHWTPLFHTDQTVADHPGRHRHAEAGDTVQSSVAAACTTGLCHPEFLCVSTGLAPRTTIERRIRDADPVGSGVATDVLEPPPKGPL